MVFCTPAGSHIYLKVLKSVQFTVPAARGKVSKLIETSADILGKFLLIISLSEAGSRHFSLSTNTDGSNDIFTGRVLGEVPMSVLMLQISIFYLLVPQYKFMVFYLHFL